MSLLRLFSGPSPEKLEEKGDALFEAGLWGNAKLEYERAFDKLKKRSGLEKGHLQELKAKILKAREALAREHRHTAGNLTEAGCLDDAREMLALAMEISTDGQFRQELKQQLQQIDTQQKQAAAAALPDLLYGLEDNDEGQMPDDVSDDEYFVALCNTLPDEVKGAYLQYGEAFKTGYVALNRGDFQTAATSLSRAMEENPESGSYVPLELATAYMNLDRSAEAQALLQGFLEHHPKALPAYQLLCEIYWDQKDFPRADALLATVPDAFAESAAFSLLKGETLYQAEKFEATRDYYRHFLDIYGWNDSVARELAKAHEALGESASARRIYKEMMVRCAQCNSCQTQIDPVIKHKYAQLCFADGKYGADILELYLSLVREIPEKAPQYYDRISRIYKAQGNASEAQRFRAFSTRARAEQDQR
jgi:tetratricopeptide (TPR) repeat protein